MNARQVADKAAAIARPFTRVAGTAALLAGLAIDLARAALVQRAEGKRLRLVDKRRRKP